jgi:hypothetical protein
LSPGGGSPLALADQRVAQRPKQVADLILTAQEARSREHARERLLHQILGLLPRPCPCARNAVELRKAVRYAVGVEPAQRRHQRREGIVPGGRRT